MEFRGIRLWLAIACVTWSAGAAAHDAPRLPIAEAERQALAFLKSLPREWSGTSNRDCKTYEDKNIDLLSRDFALSAAAFLRAFVDVHGHVTITSAYRSAWEQTCVCEGEKGPCAGRPRTVKTKKGKRTVRIVVRSTSNHQKGIALDVRAGTGSETEFACMHEFAALNPQFGVRFPMGKRDQPHMEPASGQRNVKLASLGGALRTIAAPCTTMRIMLIDAALD